jgi:hypothetical protein
LLAYRQLDESPAAKAATASGMNIETKEQRQRDGRNAAMIDRETLKRDRNAGRKPEKLICARSGLVRALGSLPRSPKRRMIRSSGAGNRGISAESW